MKNFEKFDQELIGFVRKISIPFSKVALFVVYFWFGILKIMGTSPANPMVESLQQATLPFITFSTFIVMFSIFEMIIGLLFIIPKMERAAILLFITHMVMTGLPLIFLPEMTWQAFFTPTLEGQYIIKNLVLIGLVMNVGAHLKPYKK